MLLPLVWFGLVWFGVVVPSIMFLLIFLFLEKVV